MITISSQQQDLSTKSHTITQSLKDKATIEIQLESMSVAFRALESEILGLRGEKAVMQEQLRSDGDSAKVLDEYKKRAQLALKKVKASYYHTHPSLSDCLRSSVVWIYVVLARLVLCSHLNQ